MTAIEETLANRMRARKHTALVGCGLPTSAPDGTILVRVACDDASSAKSPIVAARVKLARLLGEPDARHRWHDASANLRKLVGAHAPSLEATFVDTANRVAELAGLPVTLAFDRVDRADDATIAALVRTLRNPKALSLPVVVVFGATPHGAAAELLEVIRSSFGEDAVLRAADAPKAAAPAPARSIDLGEIDRDVLRVLRAGATIGRAFDAGLIALLLGAPIDHVLDALQEAKDEGLPLEDLGDGSFRLPDDTTAELAASVLPSLAAFWNGRMAQIVDTARKERDGDRSRESAPDPRPAATRSAPVQEPPPPPATPPARDAGRAAHHLEAAGRREDAASRYVLAARHSADEGDVARAIAFAHRALAATEGLPTSPERRVLRARALVEQGRAQWLGVGIDPALSLKGALASLEEAKSLLPAHAPASLRSELATLSAGVSYDLGDQRSLEKALGELSEASRSLLDDADALDAARLLDDQAALYLRLGDPVQATHLLTKSRDLFEARLRDDSSDVVAMEELAHADHLLARVPMHAPPRPGREQDAYAMGLDHAVAAERIYDKLHRPIDLARVWETMGRLEMLRGKHERALDLLQRALRAQNEAGDVTGLARTTAALSQLLASQGRLKDALDLLSDSVELNRRRSSPIGLAFNRRALTDLRKIARDRAPSREVGDALAALGAQLDREVSNLGPELLPPDFDDRARD